MADFALAAAGATVFALTTWASLVFGYQIFQNMWETDQAPEPDPVVALTDETGDVAAERPSTVRTRR